MLTALALGLLSSATYEVVAEESIVYVQVYKDRSTLLAGVSHDHVVRAAALSGTVTTNSEMSSCAAIIDLPVDRLEPDEKWMRERLGLPDEIDEDDRKEIKQNMLARGQLFAAKHRRILVEIISCKVGGSSRRVNLAGTLTVRGKQVPLAFDAEVSEVQDLLRVRGSFTKKQTDFGFEPYSAAFGTLRNRDEITFQVDIVARRRP